MKAIIGFILIFLTSKVSFSQSGDAIKITEARLALEKYNDCKNALAALNEVSTAGRNSALFQLYAGKTYDCLKDYDNAIHYYELYLNTYPNATDIIQRVAEIRYQKRKKSSQFDLAGTWYIKGSPELIRNITQAGNNIRIVDPKTPGNKGVDFIGSLQVTGIYHGGSYWYFKKKNVPGVNVSCFNDKCIFTRMEYRQNDDEFFEQTHDDILTISEDGSEISMKYAVPVIEAKRKTIEFEGKTNDFCVCSISWKTQNLTYLRIEK